MLYEGLFASGPQGTLQYGLCENLEISKDRKTYLFYIKKTSWSDGSPLTAYDLENAWLSQLNPEFPSHYSYLFYPIKNAERYKKGLCPKDDVGIKAIHPYLLKIELHKPKNDLLQLLSFSPFFPVKEGPTSLITNGPYQIVQHKPHQFIDLKKNPYYHAQTAVQPSKITIKIIDSENTAWQLFKEGQLDIIGGPLSPVPFEVLQDNRPDYKLSMAGGTVLAFNTQSNLFSNLNLRKAFCLCLQSCDLEKMLSATHTPSKRFLPLSHVQSSNIFSRSGELSSPKSFLEKGLQELKLTKKDLEQIQYYYGGKPEHAKMAQLLHELWKNHLDIDIKLVKLEQKVLSSKIASKDFEIAQLLWLAPYESPSALLDRFLDKTLSKNFSGYEDPKLSSLIHELDDPKFSPQVLMQIETHLAQTLPFFPLYEWNYSYFISPYVQELCFTNLGTINFTYIKFKQDTCSLPPR